MTSYSKKGILFFLILTFTLFVHAGGKPPAPKEDDPKLKTCLREKRECVASKNRTLDLNKSCNESKNNCEREKEKVTNLKQTCFQNNSKCIKNKEIYFNEKSICQKDIESCEVRKNEFSSEVDLCDKSKVLCKTEEKSIQDNLEREVSEKLKTQEKNRLMEIDILNLKNERDHLMRQDEVEKKNNNNLATVNSELKKVNEDLRNEIQSINNDILAGRNTKIELKKIISEIKTKIALANGALKEMKTCPSGMHYERSYSSSGMCFDNVRPCEILKGVGEDRWLNSSWQGCMVKSCDNGYKKNEEKSACLRDCPTGTHVTEADEDGLVHCVNNSKTCPIKNGLGFMTWESGKWGGCKVVKCGGGYISNHKKDACIRLHLLRPDKLKL